jgi:hypothetical protein
MAISFDQANVHVRQLIKPKIHSSFVATKPLLYFLAGQTVANLDGLGDPQMSEKGASGTMLGGAGIGRATLAMQNGSVQHQFRFQNEEADPAAHVGLAGEADAATPVATKFADDLTKMGAVKWTDFMAPLRIRSHRLDAARGDLAIGALLEESVNYGVNKNLQKHQEQLWTGTLTEAEQDEEVWNTYLGLQHTVDGTGGDFYGGQDRDVNTVLKGKEYTATQLATAGGASGTVPLLKGIRIIRTDNTVGGIANRFSGAGSLCITTAAVWNTLANEAEGKYTIFDSPGSSPQFLKGVSAQFPMIVKDTTVITYDPDCPSGELYVLTPEFWVFEVDRANNFKIKPWQDKSLNDEGGEMYMYTQIYAQTRLLCYRPDLQVKITGCTT